MTLTPTRVARKPRTWWLAKRSLRKNQATVLMTLREGLGVPVFSPHARTHKFELTKQLVEAKRFHGPWPKWLRLEVDDLLDHREPSGKIGGPSSTNTTLRSDHSTLGDGR